MSIETDWYIDGYIDSNPTKKQYGQPEKTVTTADILKKNILL